MIDLVKTLLTRQFEAALSTLNACIVRCPDDTWDKPIASLAFCQAAFHALFYTDVYLCENTEAIKQQDFHRDHPDFFRDYEEMEDRAQVLMYDKASILTYVSFCREKAVDTVAAENAASLAAPCGFPWLGISRAELYLYNIRHIQHHAAQLSLRLRLNGDAEVPWSRSGWRE